MKSLPKPPRGRRRFGFLTVCLLASFFSLATGQTLFFGAGSPSAQTATVEPSEGTPAQADTASATAESEGVTGPDEVQVAAPAPHAESGDEAAGAESADHGEAHETGEHEGEHAGHSDPVAPVLIWLVVILLFAKLGGDIFDRLGQPAVLGELVAGVLIGNVLFFLGHDFMTVLREGSTILQAGAQIAAGADPRAVLETAYPADPELMRKFLAMVEEGTFLGHVELARTLDIFSRVGVIILLFLVGLESNLVDMLKVGIASTLVAVVGVIAPFGLGYVVSLLLLPEESIYVHMFIGATLCATSVGITARVFKDLRKLHTDEAKIILGAAVIDDVLGLIILAVTQGIIVAANAPAGSEQGSMGLQILWIFTISVAFVVGAVLIGHKLQRLLTGLVSKMKVPGMKLIYSLLFAFTLSWLADAIGLAAIVGAFAAGLVLDEVHFKDWKGQQHTLEELVEPIATFLVPVFFVIMGLQVKLETFANVEIFGLAFGITLAAIIGKQVCGLVVRDPKVSKVSIGVGMIPRGEVGLIFAAIGKSLTYIGPNGRPHPVISPGTFSAVVIMVILTTLLTPPLLKITLTRHEARLKAAESGGGG